MALVQVRSGASEGVSIQLESLTGKRATRKDCDIKPEVGGSRFREPIELVANMKITIERYTRRYKPRYPLLQTNNSSSRPLTLTLKFGFTSNNPPRSMCYVLASVETFRCGHIVRTSQKMDCGKPTCRLSDFHQTNGHDCEATCSQR